MPQFKHGNPGGPGRPRRTDKHAGAVAKAEKKIADRLPSLIDNLFTLADGGYERVEEQWAPAGSLFVGSGEWQRPMYPDKDPDELVLVRRTVSVADRDRAANVYLVDRVMGKPTERKEVTGADGGALTVAFQGLLERVYGDDDSDDTPTDADLGA